MKYINKALTALCAIALMVGFSACSSEDEATAELLNGEQVYFPNTLSNTVEITSDASTVEIPVMRMGTDAVSIPVTATFGEENVIDLTVPSTVSFNANENKSKIVLTYDPTKVTTGHYDTVTLSFGNDYNTPYGNSSVALKVGQAEPWISLGTGTIYDAFSWEGTYEVEFQQNQLYPTHFRIVAPYTEAAKTENEDVDPKDGFSDYLNFTVMQPGDTYGDVTITMNDLVSFEDVNTGYYYGDYDADIYALFPGRFTSMGDESYWTYNKVLSYQENGLPAQVQLAPEYYMFGVGGWNYTQNDGMITLTFPGVVIADYSAEVAYAGKFEASDGTISAVGDVTLGEDVAAAKATVVAGRNAAEDAVNGILDGSLENVVDVKASGEVKIPMPADAESGVYTMAVVTYDAAGEAQDYGTATFNFTVSGEVEETWTPQYVGDYVYKFVFCNNDGTPYTDEGLTFSQSDQNENRYKISNIFYGVDFVFEMADDGTITFEDQYTGYTDDSAGDLMCCDMYSLYPDYFPTKSYYSNGTFYFNIGFYASDGWWGYDQSDNNDDLETFTLTGAVSSAKANKIAAKKSSKKHSVNRPEHVRKYVLGKPEKCTPSKK